MGFHEIPPRTRTPRVHKPEVNLPANLTLVRCQPHPLQRLSVIHFDAQTIAESPSEFDLPGGVTLFSECPEVVDP